MRICVNICYSFLPTNPHILRVWYSQGSTSSILSKVNSPKVFYTVFIYIRIYVLCILFLFFCCFFLSFHFFCVVVFCLPAMPIYFYMVWSYSFYCAFALNYSCSCRCFGFFVYMQRGIEQESELVTS